MNVVIINKSDSTGGAAVVSLRLLNALRRQGVKAEMLVTEKNTDNPHVHLAASRLRIKRSFLSERLKIYLKHGVNRSNLFKIDTGSRGLPLYRHSLVKKADVICLNWVNQGVLSLRGVRKLLKLGKPVVWTMHDMWCFTGICHHAGNCHNFESDCGYCPLLGKSRSAHDLSYKTLRRKQKIYRRAGRRLHFVAVSNWLAALARKSTLLGEMPLSVIPNAFPMPSEVSRCRGDRFTLLFGAARLDDPIKGLPILIEATRKLKEKYPKEAERLELVTFGNIRRPEALDGLAVSHRHLGRIDGEQNVRRLYQQADAVVSTSLYETLPGTLVEGQAYGCVPVAFNRGGQPDIIDHLHTGYLAAWSDDAAEAASNIAEGIVWAMNQEKETTRKHMLDSVASKFDESVIADRYIELFKSLLDA